MALQGKFIWRGIEIPNAYLRIIRVEGGSLDQAWKGHVAVYPSKAVLDAIPAAQAAVAAAESGQFDRSEELQSLDATVQQRLNEAETAKANVMAAERDTLTAGQALAADKENPEKDAAFESAKAAENVAVSAAVAVARLLTEARAERDEKAAQELTDTLQAAQKALATAEELAAPLPIPVSVIVPYADGEWPYTALYSRMKADLNLEDA